MWRDSQWLTAVVTSVYTIVSVFTLIVIYQQKRSIQNTERAVLVPMWDNFVHLNPEAALTGRLSHCFLVQFKNCGKTPAFINEHCAHMMLLRSMGELPKQPRYGKGVQFMGDPVVPNGTTECEFYSPLNDPRSFEEIDKEIRSGREILFVSGYVRYQDMFGRNHQTRYGLRYRAAEQCKMDYDGFLVDGPKRYNKYL